MRGDAVGAGAHRKLGGAHGIGMSAAARVPYRRDMVDIDAEAEGFHWLTPRLPGFSAGMVLRCAGSLSAGHAFTLSSASGISGTSKSALPPERSMKQASPTTSAAGLPHRRRCFARR